MSMFQSLAERYRQLPRAGRWATWLVLIVVGHFAAVEPLLNWSGDSAAKAEKLEKALAARARLADQAGSSGALLERSIVAFGSPRTPRTGLADPSGFLSQKTADLAVKHGVTVKRRTRKGSTPIPNYEWNGARVERVALELLIECDTDQFLAMLKELESLPEITHISAVRLNKVQEPGVSLADSTVMQIAVVPEVWVIAGTATAQPSPLDAPEATPVSTPSDAPASGSAVPAPSPAAAPLPENNTQGTPTPAPATPQPPSTPPGQGATP